MENQTANRDALISVTLGAIVTIIATASVVNLLFPTPAFIPFSTNATVEQPET